MVVTVVGTNPSVPALIQVPEQTPIYGGEGLIFFADAFAVKIYHDWDAAARGRLERILPLGRHTRPEHRQAWPIGIVVAVDGHPALGVVFFKLPARMETLYRVIFSPGWADKFFARGGTYGHLLQVAQGTANALHRLHATGVFHTDFHFKNILVDPLRGDVALVDLDGIALSGRPASPGRGIRQFIAPEQLLGDDQPGRAKDLYGLAVVLGWTLLLRDPLLAGASGAGQPANLGGALDWRSLTPALQALAHKALIGGRLHPAARPLASDWSAALADASDAVVDCSGCRQRVIYPFWLSPPARRSCPFCGGRWQAQAPVVLAIGHPDPAGSERAVRHIVLAPGVDLRASAFGLSRHPPFGHATDPVIARLCRASGPAPRLANIGSEPWRAWPGGGLVTPGASIELHPGTRLSPAQGRVTLRVVE